MEYRLQVTSPFGRGGLPKAKAWTPTIVAAALIVIAASVFFLLPTTGPEVVPPATTIATLEKLDGAVQWTGNGGQVSFDLESGQQLTGGTLESLSVDSSAELRFHDGSAVTVFGAFTLTISDRGQKKLHLRRGNLSAAVEKQPSGKPLLVLT